MSEFGTVLPLTHCTLKKKEQAASKLACPRKLASGSAGPKTEGFGEATLNAVLQGHEERVDVFKPLELRLVNLRDEFPGEREIKKQIRKLLPAS